MDKYLSSIVNQNLVDVDWKPVVEEIAGQFSWIVGTLLIYQAQQVIRNFTT